MTEWLSEQEALVVKTAPTVEPISTAEAKTHSRIDTAADDDYIDTLIQSARENCEAYTRRAFLTQTWYYYLTEFPTIIRLPKPPLQSVTSIKYIDANGDSQTWSSDEYQVNTKTIIGLIRLAKSCNYPTIDADYDNPITIEYICGYGAAATSLPAALRHAVKELVAHMYEHREPELYGTISKTLPMTVQWLLQPYVVDAFG